ncbi:unnamed protein product [Amoebophrya sp. A120]|nr:unnamed protein product [Amoebophrya sp. A120]|eukprot:GSA120T00022228001.1
MATPSQDKRKGSKGLMTSQTATSSKKRKMDEDNAAFRPSLISFMQTSSSKTTTNKEPVNKNNTASTSNRQSLASATTAPNTVEQTGKNNRSSSSSSSAVYGFHTGGSSASGKKGSLKKGGDGEDNSVFRSAEQDGEIDTVLHDARSAFDSEQKQDSTYKNDSRRASELVAPRNLLDEMEEDEDIKNASSTNKFKTDSKHQTKFKSEKTRAPSTPKKGGSHTGLDDSLFNSPDKDLLEKMDLEGEAFANSQESLGPMISSSSSSTAKQVTRVRKFSLAGSPLETTEHDENGLRKVLKTPQAPRKPGFNKGKNGKNKDSTVIDLEDSDDEEIVLFHDANNKSPDDSSSPVDDDDNELILDDINENNGAAAVAVPVQHVVQQHMQINLSPRNLNFDFAVVEEEKNEPGANGAGNERPNQRRMAMQRQDLERMIDEEDQINAGGVHQLQQQHHFPTADTVASARLRFLMEQHDGVMPERSQPAPVEDELIHLADQQDEQTPSAANLTRVALQERRNQKLVQQLKILKRETSGRTARAVNKLPEELEIFLKKAKDVVVDDSGKTQLELNEKMMRSINSTEEGALSAAGKENKNQQFFWISGKDSIAARAEEEQVYLFRPSCSFGAMHKKHRDQCVALHDKEVYKDKLLSLTKFVSDIILSSSSSMPSIRIPLLVRRSKSPALPAGTARSGWD